jgi:hypothetical protein
MMSSKLAGHGLQLSGHLLCFGGLAAAAAVIFVAGNHPSIPMWWFAAGAAALGAPLMIAGGRINLRGRRLVLNQSPEEAAGDHFESTTLLALFLAFLWLHGLWIAAPMFLRATGLGHPSDAFVSVWIVGWTLTLCAARDWISNPIWQAIERRARARWSMSRGAEDGCASDTSHDSPAASPSASRVSSARTDSRV